MSMSRNVTSFASKGMKSPRFSFSSSSLITTTTRTVIGFCPIVLWRLLVPSLIILTLQEASCNSTINSSSSSIQKSRVNAVTNNSHYHPIRSNDSESSSSSSSSSSLLLPQAIVSWNLEPTPILHLSQDKLSKSKLNGKQERRKRQNHLQKTQDQKYSNSHSHFNTQQQQHEQQQHSSRWNNPHLRKRWKKRRNQRFLRHDNNNNSNSNRNNISKENGVDDTFTWEDKLQPFLHEYNSGVYATLVEVDVEKERYRRRLKKGYGTNRAVGKRSHVEREDDMDEGDEEHWMRVEEHNRRVREFNKWRHLSRFEVQYRKDNGFSMVEDEYLVQIQQLQKKEESEEQISENEETGKENKNRRTQNVVPPMPQSQYNTNNGNDDDYQSTSTLQGGRYDTYQSVPLSQGYGTHYATVWVGSPTPQRKSVIVDTGSHYTAFPCKGCSKCGEENHTDKYFDPNQSRTFRSLLCNQCVWGATCGPIEYNNPNQRNNPSSSSVASDPNADNTITNPVRVSSATQQRYDHALHREGCLFSQSYTEGSSWQAYQVRDKFFCGGTDLLSAADPLDQKFAVDFLFGCQTSETGLFVTQLADGIMGLSSHDATLPHAMFREGKIEHDAFSLCFRQEMVVNKLGVSAGVMTLGGIDRSLESSPMVFAKNMARSGWYTVYVKSVFLRTGGGESAAHEDGTAAAGVERHVMKIPLDTTAMNSGKGVIVDSGTTDTYLHRSIARVFGDAWRQVTGRAYSNSAIRLTRNELLRLPTILVQISSFDSRRGGFDPDMYRNVVGLVGPKLDPYKPNDVLLAIPATHYMEYSPSKDLYTSRLYFTESRGGVLGANALMGHDVMFDSVNGRIGFAESTCKAAPPGSAQADDVNLKSRAATDQDCRLKQPALTVSCMDSVDASVCEEGKPDQVLTGAETWSMVVDSPATLSGMQCEDVIRGGIGRSGGRGRGRGSGVGNGGGGGTVQEMMDENGETITVICNGLGLCTRTERCEISCGELNEIHPIPPALTQTFLKEQNPDVEDPVYPCSDNAWGACMKSCVQTSTFTFLMSDGMCHEVKNQRKQRYCHVDACGRSDPCRVPFVVHTILAFRGADHNLWDTASENMFIDAFTSAANARRSRKSDQFFEAGDVKILMATPWYEHEEVTEITDLRPIGMKLVLEISIYNSNAVVKYRSGNDDGDTWKNKMRAAWKPKSRETEVSECKSSDLFVLARKAHSIHNEFELDTFMPTLMASIRRSQSEMIFMGLSPFVPVLLDHKNIDGSSVLISWTIKTEISGGEVHDHKLDPYLGRFDFVHVITAYAKDVPMMRIAVISAVLLFLWFGLDLAGIREDIRKGQCLQRRCRIPRRRCPNPYSCPNPVDAVKKRFSNIGTNNLRRRHRGRYTKVDTDDDFIYYDTSKKEERGTADYFGTAKYNSKLESIIRN